MGLNMTNFAPMLKTLYTKQKVQNLVYKKNPLFAMLNKGTEFVGESKTVPVIYGNPQGRSASFTKAQAGKTNTKSKKFTITRAKDYGLISIDGETLLASQSDAGAFASARATEIDGMFQNLTNTLEFDLFGNGSGVRGQLSASQNVALTVVTLADIQDIVKIEVDQKLRLATAATGGSERTGAMYVISVDRKAGTFVVSSSQGGSATAISTCIAAAAAGDYIYVDGDYDSKIKGLAAWLPYGGASSTSFFGVDRTEDATRLGGVWGDLSAMPLEEGLIEGAAQVDREGGSPDMAWIHTTKHADLIKALGSRVQYVDKEVMPGIGFRGVKLQTNEGVIDVFASRAIARTSCFMLQSETWKFDSLGEAPHILNLDSLASLREATSDGIEIRIGYYGQLSCNAPGWNGHFRI
jgi:hypothetical protein